MKIGVIGTRGFPDVQGGIETHCMELYSRLALLDGNSITVYRRTPYLNSRNRNAQFKNIKFVDLRVPRSKNLETFLHSFLATIHAFFQRYDIVHYHNTGPGFFIPMLKIFTGAKVIFTYHNVSYSQKKWSGFAKGFLNLSEKVSLTQSHFVIFISDILKEQMLAKYNIGHFKVISNGVNLPVPSGNSDYIESLGLEMKGYVVSVGRFLEEKGFDYLIRAFRKASLNGIRLVIAGDTDYPTEYSEKLKELARENGVILTGFIKGEKLNQIYTFARLYVMSSFEEGMPIALLEAMSYEIDVLSSDIAPNLLVGLDKDDYFKVGNEDDLKEKILLKLNKSKKHSFRELLQNRYNWDKIAAETDLAYRSLKS